MSRRSLLTTGEAGPTIVATSSQVGRIVGTATVNIPTLAGLAPGDLLLIVGYGGSGPPTKPANWDYMPNMGGGLAAFGRYVTVGEPSIYAFTGTASGTNPWDYILVAIRGLPMRSFNSGSMSPTAVCNAVGGSGVVVGGSTATAPSLTPTARSWLFYFAFLLYPPGGPATFTSTPPGMQAEIVAPGANNAEVCIARATTSTPASVATGTRTATHTGGGAVAGAYALTL